MRKTTRGTKTLWVRLPRKHGRKRVGRPRGATDIIPRSVTASVKAVVEEVVSERKLTIKDAIIDGLNGGPRYAHNYLRLCAEYTDGKPDANLNVRTSFKEDEVNTATKQLTSKMERLFKLAARATVLLPEHGDAETSIDGAHDGDQGATT